MKKMFFALIVLVGVNASATSLHPDTFALFSTLTVFEPGANSGLEDAVSGSVKVNKMRKTVTLFLSNCPINAMCLHSGAIRTIELPITRIAKTGFCDAKVYYAKRDLRPVDGGLETLKVTDLSTVRCRIRIDRNRATQVEYATEFYSRGMEVPVKSKSHFEGTLLHGGK